MLVVRAVKLVRSVKSVASINSDPVIDPTITTYSVCPGVPYSLDILWFISNANICDLGKKIETPHLFTKMSKAQHPPPKEFLNDRDLDPSKESSRQIQ